MANELEALRPLRQEVQELRAALRSGGAVPVATPKPVEPPTEGAAKRSESKAPLKRVQARDRRTLEATRRPVASKVRHRAEEILAAWHQCRTGPCGQLEHVGQGQVLRAFWRFARGPSGGEFLYYGGRGTEVGRMASSTSAS